MDTGSVVPHILLQSIGVESAPEGVYESFKMDRERALQLLASQASFLRGHESFRRPTATAAKPST